MSYLWNTKNNQSILFSCAVLAFYFCTRPSLAEAVFTYFQLVKPGCTMSTFVSWPTVFVWLLLLTIYSGKNCFWLFYLDLVHVKLFSLYL